MASKELIGWYGPFVVHPLETESAGEQKVPFSAQNIENTVLSERTCRHQGARNDIQERVPECELGRARDQVRNKRGVPQGNRGAAPCFPSRQFSQLEQSAGLGRTPQVAAGSAGDLLGQTRATAALAARQREPVDSSRILKPVSGPARVMTTCRASDMFLNGPGTYLLFGAPVFLLACSARYLESSSHPTAIETRNQNIPR